MAGRFWILAHSCFYPIGEVTSTNRLAEQPSMKSADH